MTDTPTNDADREALEAFAIRLDACPDDTPDDAFIQISTTDGEVRRLRSAIRALTRPPLADAGEVDASRIAEEIDEGGSWYACTGCQESVDGCVSSRDYPYSETFRCQPGGGCSECGGIGVIWEPAGYWDGLWDEGDTLTTALTPAPATVDVRENDSDDPCAGGTHCCCCEPGDKCCDCGQIRPDQEELPALRAALSDLLGACLIADAKEDLSADIDGDLLDAAMEALELRYPIIWTAEQVEMLTLRQDEASSHPYTCARRSDTKAQIEAHSAQADEDGDAEPGLLFATRRGWKCPACDYRQFWSHETGGPNALRAQPPAPDGMVR